ANWDTGAVKGLSNVFGLGNVLTGKGNIRDSRENAEVVSQQVIRDYLGIDEHTGDMLAPEHAAAHERAKTIADSAIRRAKIMPDRLKAIAQAIEGRWQKVGYEGDYASWIARNKPTA